VNTEELEQSLRAEFEGYMKNVLGEMRRDVADLQGKFEGEFEKHRSLMDGAFRSLSSRFDSAVEFDPVFRESVTEHLRLARDEGALVTAKALGEAEKLGIPIYVLFHHDHMHLLDRLAERYPGLRLVVDHLGLNSHLKDDACFVDLDKLLVLAKRPNVAVKSSALPCYSTQDYPFANLHPYVRRVFDAFGPRRMFWGTDWSRLPCSWKQGITLFTEELPWLRGEDLELVMGKALCDWIGWKV